MANYFPAAMPLPAVDHDNQGYWDGCKEHKLKIQRCKRCGTFRHAPSPVCFQCHSFEHEYVESQGLGEVYSFIIVHHPVHPATKDVVPYNAVVVQLRDCGNVKITSNILGVRNEDIKIGMPVKVTWEDVAPDVSLPRFVLLKQ